MHKGTIFFNNLAMPFDLIIKNDTQSILVFIPYSDEDILRLIENNISSAVIEDKEGLKGRYLRIKVSLSEINSIVFEHNFYCLERD